MPPQTLTYDEIDDLIYSSRTGDLSALQELVQDLSKKYQKPHTAIFEAAIDIDEEGLGSQSCLLHYPAANGNLEIVQYLLGHSNSKAESSAKEHIVNGDKPGAVTEIKEPRSNFINHRNVSGNTPLHWAGMNGHLEVVKALIQAGANPEIVNGAGRDAVVESEWSSKPGSDECAVWMLKECGGLEKGVGEEGRDIDGMDGVDAAVEDIEEDSNNVDEEAGPSTTHSSG